MKVSKWVVLEMVLPRVNKFNATPTRKALGTSEGVLFKHSDEHTCPFCKGAPLRGLTHHSKFVT